MMKFLLFAHQMELDEVDTIKLKRLVYNLCALSNDYYAVYPLLWAVSEARTDVMGRCPMMRGAVERMINNMIDFTKNLDVRDESGRTVLHCVTYNQCRSESPQIQELQHRYVKRLLVRGAHPDIRDHQGAAPIDFSRRNLLTHHIINLATGMSLQCLAAGAVRHARMPYVGIVSQQLREFVDLH
jgi:ankyrin repeat protein